MSVKFYGHSDDCAEVDGVALYAFDGNGETVEPSRCTREELGCYEQVVTFAVRPPDRVGGVIVELRFFGQWQVGIRQTDEDAPFPWKVEIVAEHGYSVAAVVHCGEDAIIELVSRERA